MVELQIMNYDLGHLSIITLIFSSSFFHFALTLLLICLIMGYGAAYLQAMVWSLRNNKKHTYYLGAVHIVIKTIKRLQNYVV